jgi:hypothetical protein
MAIYDGLGPDGRNALENVRAEAIYQGLPVTCVLRFPRDGVPVAAPPWEIMANQDGPILLSRGNHVDSCERYMDIDRALPPQLRVGRKPHFLSSGGYSKIEPERSPHSFRCTVHLLTR